MSPTLNLTSPLTFTTQPNILTVSSRAHQHGARLSDQTIIFFFKNAATNNLSIYQPFLTSRSQLSDLTVTTLVLPSTPDLILA